MIPGEMLIKDGEIELNAGRRTMTLSVTNSGDRPIQVGSHYHFFETNPALKFERKTGARHAARYRRRHRGALRTRPDPRGHPGRARRQAHGLRVQAGGDGQALTGNRRNGRHACQDRHCAAGRRRARRLRVRGARVHLRVRGAGFRPSCISGVSIGAFTAAIVASHPDDPLPKLQIVLGRADGVSLVVPACGCREVSRLFRQPGLLSAAPRPARAAVLDQFLRARVRSGRPWSAMSIWSGLLGPRSSWS